MKRKTIKGKRAVAASMAVVCAFLSVTAINAGAISYSPDGHSVTVTSSDTTNGYSLKLSSQDGRAVGSLWSVTNGGPTTLKSKNSVQYVKTNGTTAIYSGNNSFITSDSTYQLRTVSTSKLNGYSRLAKIEASGYASCISTSAVSNRTVFINAYY